MLSRLVSLWANAYYQYRIEAWDAISGDVDNFSKTNMFRFYTGMPGDVNTDGVVDLQDAIGTVQVSSGLPAPSWASRIGDSNADGKIGQSEALFILQGEAGVR